MRHALAAGAARRIIFVGGVHGRTGTSVVKRLLCHHPDVSAVSGGETRMLEAICELWPMLLADVAYCPGGAVSALAAFESHVRAVLGDTPELRTALEEFEYRLGVRYQRLAGQPRRPLPLPQESENLASALSAFVAAAFSAAALDPACPVLCEKTPSNSQYFGLLSKILPDSPIVVMVRNPIAVALSHTQREWGPADPVQAAVYTGAYFRRWRLMNISNPSCLVVRLEDLVAEADRIFPLILDHLRLRPDDGVLRRACSQLRPGVDRRPALPAPQLAAIRLRLRDELDAFGYSTSASRP